MSYCRWSSMDHKCDLYVYADVHGGYTCHVAGMKRMSDTPYPESPDKWGELPVEEFMKWREAQDKWMEESTLVPIGLPYDGESFYNQDRDTMVNTLITLKEAGYNMPDNLIETIQSEEDEDETSDS